MLAETLLTLYRAFSCLGSNLQKSKSASKEVATESDDRDEVEQFQIVSEEEELELADNLHPLIRKVRTIVKMSPTKNDILQK